VPAGALARERYLSLATFRRDGTVVATPVWFAALDGVLYVVTGGESGKVKRLRRAPRARVAACSARGAVLGPWHEATARIVADEALVRRAHGALRAKYGWQVRLLDLVSRLTGRARRRAWLEIRLAA
jgi:PPOX class probable F420-dependent enzyme